MSKSKIPPSLRGKQRRQGWSFRAWGMLMLKLWNLVMSGQLQFFFFLESTLGGFAGPEFRIWSNHEQPRTFHHLNTTSTSIYTRFIMVWSALPALLFLHTFAITIQYYPVITGPETAWCRWDLQCARTSRTVFFHHWDGALAASSRGHLDQWRFKDDDAQHAAQEKTSIIIHRHLARYGCKMVYPLVN